MAATTHRATVGQSSGIDVLAIQYGFFIVDPNDGSLIQLWPSALTWEEQTGEFAERLTATFPNIQTPSGWVHDIVALAGQFHLYADWGQGAIEVMRGQIWKWTFTDNGHEEVQIVCYDRLMFLQRSKDSKSYNLGADPLGVAIPAALGDRPMPIVTAGAIIDDLARRWQFSVAGTELLNRTMPAMVWTRVPLSQMILELLDRTYWLGSGAFVFRTKNDQIEVVPPATNRPIYLLTADQLNDYSDSQSMEDLVTRVVIIGTITGSTAGVDPVADPNDYLKPIAAILDGDTHLGIMQDIIDWPASIGVPDVFQVAKQTIANRGQVQRIQRFDAPDLPFLRRGDCIAVTAGTLSGIFIITGIQHDAATKRMQITIDTSGDLTDPSASYILESTAIDPHAFIPGGTGNPDHALGQTRFMPPVGGLGT